jgi:hypothetical protein
MNVILPLNHAGKDKSVFIKKILNGFIFCKVPNILFPRINYFLNFFLTSP